MGLLELHTCCFCCTLRHGALLAVATSLASHMSLLLLAVSLTTLRRDEVTPVVPSVVGVRVFFVVTAAAAGAYALSLLLDVVLLVGLLRHQPRLFLPWMMWMPFTLSVHTVALCAVLVQAMVIYHRDHLPDSLVPFGLIGLAFTMLFIYFTVVVYSHYKTTKRSQALAAAMTAMAAMRMRVDPHNVVEVFRRSHGDKDARSDASAAAASQKLLSVFRAHKQAELESGAHSSDDTTQSRQQSAEVSHPATARRVVSSERAEHAPTPKQSSQNMLTTSRPSVSGPESRASGPISPNKLTVPVID